VRSVCSDNRDMAAIVWLAEKHVPHRVCFESENATRLRPGYTHEAVSAHSMLRQGIASVDLTDECFDRVGSLGGKISSASALDDHFLGHPGACAVSRVERFARRRRHRDRLRQGAPGAVAPSVIKSSRWRRTAPNALIIGVIRLMRIAWTTTVSAGANRQESARPADEFRILGRGSAAMRVAGVDRRGQQPARSTMPGRRRAPVSAALLSCVRGERLAFGGCARWFRGPLHTSSSLARVLSRAAAPFRTRSRARIDDARPLRGCAD